MQLIRLLMQGTLQGRNRGLKRGRGNRLYKIDGRIRIAHQTIIVVTNLRALKIGNTAGAKRGRRHNIALPDAGGHLNCAALVWLRGTPIAGRLGIERPALAASREIDVAHHLSICEVQRLLELKTSGREERLAAQLIVQ